MPEFLKLVTPDMARKILFTELQIKIRDFEVVETRHAMHRVTAEAVIAPESLPPFTRSSVDGYAVCARDTFGASESMPAYLRIVGEVPMGAAPGFSVHTGFAALIHTGGMLPEGADAVVMVEHTQLSREDEVEIHKPAAPGDNLLLAGEDLEAGNVALSAGRRLRPVEIGGLLALGITRVKVVRKPKVGILSSGDEVVPPEITPKYGQVRDINSYALGALVEEAGGEPVLYGICPDREEALREMTRRAWQENDMVVITAGSSASTRDHTAEIVSGLGKPGLLVHGINIKPGKPTILGVCDGKPVIGLPGNPISAMVIAGFFVTQALDILLGAEKKIQGRIEAILSANVPSQAGREDWVPVRISEEQGKTIANPVFFKSNLIFNLALADGLIQIPLDATGKAAGDLVDVVLF